MRDQAVWQTIPEAVHSCFSELLVAYDFSEASESSLKYAAMLAKKFGSFVHLIGVQTPSEYASALDAGPMAMEMAQRDLQFGLQNIEERLRAGGIWSDSLRRIGNISDTIEGLVLEHTPDLLLLGAYGYGAIDRPSLGSTAEYLLHTVRCPVLVVGPHAILLGREAPSIERVLCATSSLESPDDVLGHAAHLAMQLGANLELLHVIDRTDGNLPERHHEQCCEQWSTRLRDHGIATNLTLAHGRPDQAIVAQAYKSKSSLILFGLHRSGKEMIDCPDGAVRGVIREAHCPVMTIPLAFGSLT